MSGQLMHETRMRFKRFYKKYNVPIFLVRNRERVLRIRLDSSRPSKIVKLLADEPKVE
jgi:hypothetical protein